MKRNYSRLASVEERRNKKRAFSLAVLSIAALVFLVTFGLPTIVRFSSFIVDLSKTNKPVDKEDITPPAPPRIDPLPEAVNKKSIDVTGSTEPGATVTIYLNDRSEEILADKDGKFLITFNLNKGENSVYAFATDQSGNKGQSNSPQTVVFDDESPEISIESPTDGSEFFGSQQRQAAIKGQTEPGSHLTINERIVPVDEGGAFVYAATLSEGENTFNFKAQDKAGNYSEKSITLKFYP